VRLADAPGMLIMLAIKKCYMGSESPWELEVNGVQDAHQY
jgi:hypothetical protein